MIKQKLNWKTLIRNNLSKRYSRIESDCFLCATTGFYLKFVVVLLVFFSISNFNITAQVISGKVLDISTYEPIPNCNIKISGTTKGAISDIKGNFVFSHFNFPITLYVSHVGFENQYVKVEKANSNLKIALIRKSYILDSINVSANPIVNIVKDKPLYIWDYEFFEDNILILAFLDNSMFKPRLILINDFGDTLCVKPVKKARRFYKDCLDNIHLIGSDEVHQIYYDSKNLSFPYSSPLSVIDSVLNPCIEYLSGYFYMSRYYYNDQILRYYYVDEETAKYEVLSTISDSLGLVHLVDEERFAGMGTYTESDVRFAKLFFFNPVFAPLTSIDSTICIFNYSNNVIEKYDDGGNCIEVVSIDFHHIKNWKEQLLVDEVLGKVYTVFKRNGITSISEINITTGEIGKAILIPKFIFVDKLKIRNGSLYFLYMERSFTEYKKIYRMKI